MTMRDFQVFVTDDRYSVPTLWMIQAASEARACELAEAVLKESRHHKGAEVWRGERLVASLGTPIAAHSLGS